MPPYSTKSDVYALGVVMWEMAANCTRPYKDQDNSMLIIQHVKSGRREMLPDDTPTEYREWVERCWHHDPDSITFNDMEGEFNLSTAERLPQADDDVVQYFCRRAMEANGNAQLFLGWIYRHDGEFIKQNIEDSTWWYHRAAMRGNATAQFILGEIYENGHGVDPSAVEAATWYRKAAVYGVAKAQVKLGGMYEEGCGVQQNDAEAARWYRMAADQGHDGAQVKVGAWYSLGRGFDQSDAMAAEWFIKAAALGNEVAQHNLAVMYERGQGVEQNEVLAVKWFTKAAKQRYASAQAGLAVMYKQGHGVEQNNVIAAEWFTKAAYQGDTLAQTSLGWMYEHGIGVEQSDIEATKWFTKAAEKGYPATLFNLGMMHVHDRGIEQSDVEAVKLFTKAAEQGYAPALFSLGMMYDQGKGVEQSDVEAVKLFTKAAEQRHEDAQTSLGWIYSAKAFNFSRPELSKASIKKEIDILQRLHHPNIIQFYDTHTHDDGSVFLIMDLAKKGSLREVIKNRELVNWDTKTWIAHEIARGLEYIHSERVIHRDLKSANVLLTEHMTVKLADFGLSEIKIATTRSTGTFTGTIGWMAPELFAPRPRYSTKSDIYAFGMVMWEMAAMSTPPFQHDYSRVVLAALVERGDREELPDETPDEYRALVIRCWDSDPMKRPEAIDVKLIDDKVELDDKGCDTQHNSEFLSFGSSIK
ncbi:hypothetical protein BGW42_004636 [Actinomortierella wolfii]|nr:hypothetical protein BGW42_004636 [Actinomortierella wolfii]